MSSGHIGSFGFVSEHLNRFVQNAAKKMLLFVFGLISFKQMSKYVVLVAPDPTTAIEWSKKLGGNLGTAENRKTDSIKTLHAMQSRLEGIQALEQSIIQLGEIFLAMQQSVIANGDVLKSIERLLHWLRTMSAGLLLISKQRRRLLCRLGKNN